MSVTWEPEPEGGVQLGPSPAPEPGLEGRHFIFLAVQKGVRHLRPLMSVLLARTAGLILLKEVALGRPRPLKES